MKLSLFHPLCYPVPITQGLLGNMIGGSSDGFSIMIDFLDVSSIFVCLSPKCSIVLKQLLGSFANKMLQSMTNPEKIAENTDTDQGQCLNTADAGECFLTAECCKEEGFVVNCNTDNNQCAKTDATEVSGGDKSIEPFCLVWSRTSPESNMIDTLGFVPRSPWPPVEPIPFISILPLCPIPLNQLAFPVGQTGNCKFCKFKLGFAIANFSVGPVPFKLTVQFDGFALSWANNAKLAYGANSDTSGGNAPQVSIMMSIFQYFLPRISPSMRCRYGMDSETKLYQRFPASIFG